MPPIDERALIEHIVEQRWFGSKSREVIGARVVAAGRGSTPSSRCSAS